MMHLRRTVWRMVMVVEWRRRRRRSVIVIVSIMVVIIHVICRGSYSIHRTVTSMMVQMMEVGFTWRKLGFIARSHGALNVRITHQERAHVLHYFLFGGSSLSHYFYTKFSYLKLLINSSCFVKILISPALCKKLFCDYFLIHFCVKLFLSFPLRTNRTK